MCMWLGVWMNVGRVCGLGFWGGFIVFIFIFVVLFLFSFGVVRVLSSCVCIFM